MSSQLELKQDGAPIEMVKSPGGKHSYPAEWVKWASVLEEAGYDYDYVFAQIIDKKGDFGAMYAHIKKNPKRKRKSKRKYPRPEVKEPQQQPKQAKKAVAKPPKKQDAKKRPPAAEVLKTPEETTQKHKEKEQHNWKSYKDEEKKTQNDESGQKIKLRVIDDYFVPENGKKKEPKTPEVKEEKKVSVDLEDRKSNSSRTSSLVSSQKSSPETSANMKKSSSVSSSLSGKSSVDKKNAQNDDVEEKKAEKSPSKLSAMKSWFRKKVSKPKEESPKKRRNAQIVETNSVKDLVKEWENKRESKTDVGRKSVNSRS